MKRTKQCPKCQSLKVGYLPSQPDADDVVSQPTSSGGDPSMPAVRIGVGGLAHRAVGVSTDIMETGWLSHGPVHPLLGKLEAYVCAECGYHETYVGSPSTLPWGKLVGFRWVNDPVDPSGPYR